VVVAVAVVQQPVSLVVLVGVVERPLLLVALETLHRHHRHKEIMAVHTTVVVAAHLRLALMDTVLAGHKQEKVEMELRHL
jgi:hypothetical protein